MKTIAVRGLHSFAPKNRAEVEACAKFIREVLPKGGGAP